MELDLLAIGTHPDDIELTCSGTVAKCIRTGYSAGIIDLTQGELGTRGNSDIRLREAKKGAKVLGVTIRENLRIPDGNIEVNQKNILKLVTAIRRYRPKILLIPHSVERHPDHVHAHYLSREAWFYAGLRKIKTNLNGKLQEPWRPYHCFHYMQWHEFTPSFIVDISGVFDIRMDSIKAHRSQFYDPKSRDPETLLSQKTFFDFIETRCKSYGNKIGAQYGEPFYSIDAVGIQDLFSLQMFRG